MTKDLRRLLATLGDLPGLNDDDHDGDDGSPPHSAHAADSAQDVDALLQAWQALTRPQRFRPGDIVRWKRTPGGQCLSNRRRPTRDEFAVVVGVLDTPLPLVDPDADSGSPAWQEPLDLQLGLLDDDGEFIVYHYHSARFEPVPARSAARQATETLRELQRSLARREALRPGQPVRWKPHMKNRKWPAVGQAAVVLEVLDTPRTDPKASAGTPYFNEPLDLVLGLLVDGEFLRMHTDAHRFEPLPDVPGQPDDASASD